MDDFLHIASWILLLSGGFFGISGGIGILRFPDFYTRLHAAGVTDTACAGLILLGLMLQAGWGLVTVKLIFILLFLMFTSPTASHALGKAALHGKLQPMYRKSAARTKTTPRGTAAKKKRATTKKRGGKSSRT